VGYTRFCVNGKVYSYLVFRAGYGFLALAEILKKRNNNAGSWYSSNAAAQADYQKKLNAINTQYA